MPPRRGYRLFSCLAVFALCLAVVTAGWRPAQAAGADSFIVVDANSGRVLNAMNPDLRLYPASMTKIMTLYMTFEALSQGRLSLRTQLPVSELAASQAPSKLGLRPGSTISVEACIYAAVTLSANDCAMVLAEGIGGSKENFAQLMTSRAHSIGMLNTHYNNPNGLPDEGQITTARDMATLAASLMQRYPKYYPYFATRVFTYNGVPHANHNHLMSRYPGMDGIKTGFIRASGFNLTASAVRQGHRLIAVVFGGASAVSRDNYMAGLLDDGFRRVMKLPSVTPGLQAAPGPQTIAGLIQAPAPVPPEPPADAAKAVQPAPQQVDGIALAEAGDAVEANESATPAPPAVSDGPVIGETKAVAIAPLAPSSPTPAAPAPVQVVTAAPIPALAVAPQKLIVPSRIQPEPVEETAEGDADIPEPPPHVLRAPTTRIGLRPPAPRVWHVQLNTYTSKVVSDAVLEKAVASLPSDIRQKAHPVSHVLVTHGRKIYRAEIAGFDQASAKKACSVLTHCVPLKS